MADSVAQKLALFMINRARYVAHSTREKQGRMVDSNVIADELDACMFAFSFLPIWIGFSG